MGFAGILEALEPRRLLATYFVAPTGDDNASGLAPEQAWRTVERVNLHRLRAGDVILFQGGKSFDGGLYVSTKEAGSAAKPIVFSSFGAGRATIRSGSVEGLQVSEVAGIAVTNLNFVGAGADVSDFSGIYIHAGSANKVLSGVHIRNVDVSGYGHEGFTLIASGAASTVSDVKIERSSFHDNGWGGVNVTGSLANSNRNYIVDHVRAYDNRGQMTQEGGFVTGNGIYLADVADAVVQRCVVHDNGAGGVAPVGIWASGSTRVLFQYNESYDNRTASSTDGGGFDFDWDMTDSVMQYNYSHGNDGPGYMLGAGSHVNSGNVIRYNVSENDGRKNGKPAIYLWGNVSNANVYNNAVYMSATGNSSSAAVGASDVGANGDIPQLVWLRNNVLQVEPGTKLISFTPAIASNSAIALGGNAYWAGDVSTFRIQWGATSYVSLAAWRDATGEERYRGVASGYDSNPRLIDPGHGGTIGDADRLGALAAYRLRRNSRLVDKGLPQLGGAVAADYFGEAAPLGRKYDIGVDELA